MPNTFTFPRLLFLLVCGSVLFELAFSETEMIGYNGQPTDDFCSKDPKKLTLKCYSYSSFPTSSDLNGSSTTNNNIKELHIGSSKVEKLTSGSLFQLNLPSLQILSIVACSLREIENGAFRGGGENLVELNLEHNSLQLSTLDLKVFEDLPNLQKLQLSGNRFKKFEDSESSKFPKELKNLKELDLSSCLLYSIPQNLFKNLKSLEKLDLSDNQLRKLDWKAILPLGNLKAINLFSNPWHPDCHMRSLLGFIDKKNISIQRFPGEDKITGKELASGINFVDCPPSVSQLNIEENSDRGNVSLPDSKAVVLKCFFSGFPIPEVKWKRNGEELRENGTDGAEEQVKMTATKPATNSKEEEKFAEFSNEFTQTLMIMQQTDASVAAAGDYECFVSNRAGNASKLITFNSTSVSLSEGKDQVTPRMFNLFIAYLASVFP